MPSSERNKWVLLKDTSKPIAFLKVVTATQGAARASASPSQGLRLLPERTERMVKE